MIEKKIKLTDHDLRYKIRTSQRSKRIRLTIYCDGNVIATVPPKYSMDTLEKFILRKSDWVLKKIDFFKYDWRERDSIFFQYGKINYKKNKAVALGIIDEKLRRYALVYGVSYKKVAIRNQKARWGSCSRCGNLSFNYRIMYLPDKFADYVIVHELCHLKEFNHSRAFWDLVARTFPDYKNIRREIRRL